MYTNDLPISNEKYDNFKKVGDANCQITDYYVYSINDETKQSSIQL